MDNSISRGLHITFLLHAIVAVILGALLWLIPGQSLSFLDWVPETLTIGNTDVSGPGTYLVDPIITRLLGAALLAMAFSSFLGWRAEKWDQVKLLVQFEAVYCILAVIAFVAVLILDRPFNWIRWVTLIVIAAFAVAWSLAYWRHRSA